MAAKLDKKSSKTSAKPATENEAKKSSPMVLVLVAVIALALAAGAYFFLLGGEPEVEGAATPAPTSSTGAAPKASPSAAPSPADPSRVFDHEPRDPFAPVPGLGPVSG